MYRRILRAATQVRRRWRLAQDESRLDREAISEPVLRFWRDHGREWASVEARPQDLAIVNRLFQRVNHLSDREKQTEVLAAFQRIWREGFSDAASAFPWDGLNDRLPAAALVAFAEGAAAVFAERQQQL